MAECVHNCGREAGKSGECKNCRQGFYYWRKKSPKEVIVRRAKLDVLSSRLDTHFNTRGRTNEEMVVQPAPQTTRSNVVLLRTRRRA